VWLLVLAGCPGTVEETLPPAETSTCAIDTSPMGPSAHTDKCTVETWDVSTIFADGKDIIVDGDPSDWPEAARVSIDLTNDHHTLPDAADLTAFYAMIGGYDLVFRFDTAMPPTGTEPFAYRVTFAVNDEPNWSHRDVAALNVGYGLGSFLVDLETFEETYLLTQAEQSVGEVVEVRIPRNLLPAEVQQPFVIHPSVVQFTNEQLPYLHDMGGGMILGDGHWYQCEEPVELADGPVPLKGWRETGVDEAAFLHMFSRSLPLLPRIEEQVGWSWPAGHDLWVAHLLKELDKDAAVDTELGSVTSGPHFGLGLVSHELGHQFNAFVHPERWLHEGHSEFLRRDAYATFEGEWPFGSYWAGFPYQAVVDEANFVGETGFPVLAGWQGGGFVPARYGASLLVIRGLVLKYGREPVMMAYQRLYERYRYHWKGYQADVDITAEFQALLEEEVGESVAWLFDSWVHGQRPFPEGLGPLDAVDSDEDGLLDIEETIVGTDSTKLDTDGDGLGDGWELWAGLNPLSMDERLQVAIDGSDADWAGECSAVGAASDPLNGACPIEATVTDHLVVLGDERVCGFVRTAGAHEDLIMGIGLQQDGSEELAASAGHDGRVWLWNLRDDAEVWPYRRAGTGEFVEFCLGRELLEGVGSAESGDWTYAVWAGYRGTDGEYMPCDWESLLALH
jgi:hypothetical protein